ncbi:dehydrogenase-related protein [Pyrodictium delaneyi]|nr:Gfo/Idh/MocA family oxidoreductase [Pyrodictium delaneyi]ALL01984.1 dehydrogenase-related protein [Pyrodictium delaneyi]
MTVRVAVVGAGYMGSAHARVVRRIAGEYPGLVELAYIVDVDLERARLAAARYGGEPLRSVRDIPRGGADFAIVAVPTRHHLRVVLELLDRGVGGLLVEKPLTADIEEAIRLVERVEEAGVWASVGHVERFNPAVWSLHRLAARGRLGDILTIAARRVGPFAPRAGDTDVVYDLGVHEVDNALALTGSLPETVRAYTLRSIVTDLNDYALMVLGFRGGFASLEVNRITPFKQRVLYLTGSRGVAYLDYMGQELRVYTPEEESLIRVAREEPLYLEDLVLLASFAHGREPLVDIYQGFAAMLVCAAVLASARLGGELALDEYDVYQGYRGYVEKSLRGYMRYREAVGDEPKALLGL